MNSRWHPKRLLRFSMAALLFAMVASSIGLGSYTAGKQAGKRQRDAETYAIKTYPLADLAAQEPDQASRSRLVDEIADHLKSTVAPASWHRNDGDDATGEIQSHRAAAVLIIRQTGEVQDQLEIALAKFRDDRSREQTEQIISRVESLAAEERADPTVLISFPNGGKLSLAAAETYFDNLVPRLNAQWGSPRFVGDCDERGFPAWSLAHSIAQWSKPNGDVYVAVQDWPEQGRVIIGGWRRRE